MKTKWCIIMKYGSLFGSLFFACLNVAYSQETELSGKQKQFIENMKGTYYVELDHIRCNAHLSIQDLRAINEKREKNDTAYVYYNDCITIGILPEAVVLDDGFVRKNKVLIKNR